MLIKWNEQTEQWFQNASVYTGFHKRLAEIIRPYIKEGGTLCDLGCGLGLADYELLDFVGHITCVDAEAEAVRLLSENVRRRGIENIDVVHADATRLSGCWDTVTTFFHGRACDIVPGYLALSRGNVISVVHDEVIGTFGPREYKTPKTNTVSTFSEYFDERGIKYTLLRESAEYGQPMVDYEDARVFVSAYSKNAPGEAVDEYLERCLERTGRDDFPFYLPRLKPFGVFILEGTANENV